MLIPPLKHTHTNGAISVSLIEINGLGNPSDRVRKPDLPYETRTQKSTPGTCGCEVTVTMLTT